VRPDRGGAELDRAGVLADHDRVAGRREVDAEADAALAGAGVGGVGEDHRAVGAVPDDEHDGVGLAGERDGAELHRVDEVAGVDRAALGRRRDPATAEHVVRPFTALGPRHVAGAVEAGDEHVAVVVDVTGQFDLAGAAAERHRADDLAADHDRVAVGADRDRSGEVGRPVLVDGGETAAGRRLGTRVGLAAGLLHPGERARRRVAGDEHVGVAARRQGRRVRARPERGARTEEADDHRAAVGQHRDRLDPVVGTHRRGRIGGRSLDALRPLEGAVGGVPGDEPVARLGGARQRRGRAGGVGQRGRTGGQAGEVEPAVGRERHRGAVIARRLAPEAEIAGGRSPGPHGPVERAVGGVAGQEAVGLAARRQRGRCGTGPERGRVTEVPGHRDRPVGGERHLHAGRARLLGPDQLVVGVEHGDEPAPRLGVGRRPGSREGHLRCTAADDDGAEVLPDHHRAPVGSEPDVEQHVEVLTCGRRGRRDVVGVHPGDV
jgi:hypothetical protein